MLDGKRIIIAVLLSGLMMTLCSPLSSYAVDADFLSTPSGLSVESAQASEETVESAHLPIYVAIDREAEQITLINRNDFPVDLDIVALDQEGFPIARWPLRVSPTPTEMTVNFADIFWGVPQHQIASIKVTSDEPIKIVENGQDESQDSGRLSTRDMSPSLQSLSIASAPNLKLPLPANKSWLLTVQTGGKDLWGSTDYYHTDAANGYYSLDFDDISKESGQEIDVPILAAAAGTVIYAGGTSTNYCGTTVGSWGYNVLIDHGGGFKTRYTHLKNSPLVTAGLPVVQGQPIGVMGNTGTSCGSHLHFQLSYNDVSKSTTTELQGIVVDGKPIENYKVGTTTGLLYYLSTNANGSCADLGEPNGAFSSAYAVSCGATASAKICSSTDIDYYKVTPSTSGTMTIRMTPPSDKDYDLYIYNGSQAQVCSSVAGTGLQDVCPVTVTGGQTYYAKVIGYTGADYSPTSNYTLGISCSVTPGAVSANPASGTWTSSPQNVSVSSSNATTIYYTIRTTLDGTTPADPPEPSSTLNDGSISGSAGIFQVSASAGQNKKLKVRVRGYNGGGYGPTSGSYLYTINLGGSATCADLGEPNGAFSSAYAVSCGATASAKICSSTDIDYYKVTPSTSGTMTIRMTPPSDKDYDLYIYNAGQAQVCSSAAGTGLQDVCNVSVTAGQTYYSKVIGYGGAYSTTSNYGLGMTCPSGTVTPGAVSANPASGTWYASPVNLNVSSSGATTIYYTMVNTYDGSTPSDPPAPSPSANNGSLSGPSGVFQLYASSGQYKRSKLRFIGCNSRGCGSASGSFLYALDLRTVPGSVSVSPSSGTWYASPVNLNVSSSGATTIYYTMVNTYDGSTPSDPPAPSPSANNGSLSGPSGVFQLYASSGQYKRSKLRFIGCNSRGCGSASGSFSYTIDR